MGPLHSLLTLARAQEPVPEPLPIEAPAPEPLPIEAPAPEPPPVADEEVVVWGQLAIEKARDRLVAEMEALGFSVARRGEGDVVFRTNSAFLGRIRFAEDGTLSFGAPVAGLTETPPESWQEQQIDPRAAPLTGGGVSFWAFPSSGKREQARDRVREATRDEIEAYVTVVRRTALEEAVAALPEQLDALWTSGTPLEGTQVLATPAERRGAVLEYWATRTATPEGDRVRAAIESWLRAVVQSSSDPITAEERARYESRAGRPLPE